MTNLTVKEIVEYFLKKYRFDGLYEPGECACEVDDLFPCDSEGALSCRAGHKVLFPDNKCDCEHGNCAWHIGPKEE